MSEDFVPVEGLGLLERMENFAHMSIPPHPLTLEAAAEIRRLRALIADLYGLGLLVEEAGELGQIIGKALRFGLDAPGPDREPYLGLTARQLLPVEGGDMMAAIEWATEDGLMARKATGDRARLKLAKLLDPSAKDSNGKALAPRPRGASE